MLASRTNESKRHMPFGYVVTLPSTGWAIDGREQAPG